MRQLKKELMPIQLNQIYIIDNKTTRIATVKNNLFYKNILPKGVAKKQLRIYAIKSRIEVSTS